MTTSPASVRRSSSARASAALRARVAVDHPQAVALVLRIQPDEGRVANQDLRLEHAVRQRRDDAQPHRLAGGAGHHEVVAERRVEDVLQRRRVDDRRDRAVVEAAIEQPPRVGALGVGRIGNRRGEGEAAAARHEGRRRRRDARVVRAIQVEAAAVVARAHAEQIEGRRRRASAPDRASRARTASGLRRWPDRTSAAPPTPPSAM